jgi:hypothetical protein
MKTRGVKKIVSINKNRHATTMSELPGRIGRHIKLHLKNLLYKKF